MLKIVFISFALLQAVLAVRYIGCYKDAANRDLNGFIQLIGASNTIPKCIEICKGRKFKYAGLQAGQWCLCGNFYGKYGAARPRHECGLRCPGNLFTNCGGGWRNSVYETGFNRQKYMGCYKDTANRDLNGYLHHVGGGNNIPHCINKCTSLGFAYAGLQAGSWCLCGNRVGKYGKVPSNQCSSPCPGNKSTKCGAGWKNSVYKTGHPAGYMGCYKDAAARDLVGYIHNHLATNKIEPCISRCRARGFKYAGLQAGTWCLCGNSYGRYGKVADKECRMNCPADGSQQCGSGWRNSVYKTRTTYPAGYLGCFQDSGNRDLVGYIHNNGAGNTIDKCVIKCRSLGYRYAGLQAATWCLCGNNYGKYGRKANSDCSMVCPGNKEHQCGTGWKNSVYRTGAGAGTYMGCYKDAAIRDLDGFMWHVGATNTVNKCVHKCISLGFAYAGLQAGSWCLCGNRKGKYGKVPEGQCSSKCTGKKSIHCGAGWKNSVYSTGYPAGYMGCYKDAANRDLRGYLHNHGGANQIGPCITRCRQKGFKYAGLQAGYWCLCGNHYGKYGKVADSQCASLCPANKRQKCGAGWRNSVYKTRDVHPVGYLGCFKDKAARDLNGFIHNNGWANTIQLCRNQCRSRHFAYAGLQAGTWCLCGNRHGIYGKVDDAKCARVCPGNREQKCGTDWTNSVYRV